LPALPWQLVLDLLATFDDQGQVQSLFLQQLKSRIGLPLTAIRSAYAPGAMQPSFPVMPMISALTTVAAAMTSCGRCVRERNKNSSD
jgi:hypothetical protein